MKLATLYLVYFAAGSIVADYDKLERAMLKPSVIALCFLGVVLATDFWTSGATSMINIVLKVVVSFSVICLLYVVCSTWQWNSHIDGFIQRCGRESLVIYVMHWPFVHIGIKLMLSDNEVIGIGVNLLIAIAVCHVCFLVKRLMSSSKYLDFLFFGNYKVIKHGICQEIKK